MGHRKVLPSPMTFPEIPDTWNLPYAITNTPATFTCSSSYPIPSPSHYLIVKSFTSTLLITATGVLFVQVEKSLCSSGKNGKSNPWLFILIKTLKQAHLHTSDILCSPSGTPVWSCGRDIAICILVMHISVHITIIKPTSCFVEQSCMLLIESL